MASSRRVVASLLLLAVGGLTYSLWPDQAARKQPTPNQPAALATAATVRIAAERSTALVPHLTLSRGYVRLRVTPRVAAP